VPEWIPYETSDSPALEVTFDADLIGDRDFQHTHPHCATLILSQFPAGSDGQPEDGAADALFAFEQRVEAQCSTNDAALVCTASGNRAYMLVAYSAQPLTAALQALTDAPFHVEISSKLDEGWGIYASYALHGEELERARDADLLAQMHESGEDLDADFDVTFVWTLPQTANLNEANALLRDAGFEIDEPIEDEPTEDYENIIAATRTMDLTVDTLASVRAELGKLLAPLGATYDYWEASPLDDDDANLEAMP